MDSKKREHFGATVKKYGRISWLCALGAVGLGGYAVYSRNPIAATLAFVCFLGFFVAPMMPSFKKGKASLPGLGSVEVEVEPLAGDRSPDTTPSEEKGITVVEPPDDAQNQESPPRRE